jgi:predicted lipoprotein
MMLTPGVGRAGVVSKEAALEHLARLIIAPDYRELAAKCAALSAALEGFEKKPGAETLEASRKAWRDALTASARVRWLQSGPMADREFLSTFYYSKITQNRIEAVISSSGAIDSASVAELGPSAKGMFSLEYLLFGQRAGPGGAAPNDSEAGFKALFAANALRRCQLSTALAKDMQRKAQIVSEEWISPNATNGAVKFAAGGQQTLNSVINQFAQMAENIAENQIGFVLKLPAPVMQQVDRIEAGRSSSSWQEISAMQEGLRDAWQGKDGLGIEGYLRTLNAPLAAKTEQAFKQATAALAAVTLPVEEAVTAQKQQAEAAYQAVHQLELLLKVDVASALGVTITFTSGDGD